MYLPYFDYIDDYTYMTVGPLSDPLIQAKAKGDLVMSCDLHFYSNAFVKDNHQRYGMFIAVKLVHKNWYIIVQICFKGKR